MTLAKRISDIKKKLVKEKYEAALKWYKGKDGGLSEEYQVAGIQFAFVSPYNEVCHQWVLCRDFLHDAVKARLVKKPFCIYGFSYDTANQPELDLDKIRMAVSKKNKLSSSQTEAFAKSMLLAKKMINTLEQLVGVVPENYTNIFEVDPSGSNRSVVYLFVGDKFWITAPMFISLFTLIIRLSENDIEFESVDDLFDALGKMSKYVGGDKKDFTYVKEILPRLRLILENHERLIKPTESGFHSMFFKDIDNSSFHHRSGIVSTLTGRCSFDELNILIHDESKKLTVKN